MNGSAEDGHQDHNWLHSLPALVAIILGSVYALGAINIFGQLLAADVSPQQVLTQVPIEQLLARGIGSILTPAALVVALLLVLRGIFFVLELALSTKSEPEAAPEPKSKSKSPSQPKRRGWLYWLTHLHEKPLLVGTFVVVFSALFMDPLSFATVALSFVAGVCALIALDGLLDWGRSYGWWSGFILWMSAVTIAGAIVGSFLRANPLPDTVVHLRSGGCIEGGLVLDDGDSLFIQTKDDNVTAVPSRNIETSQVHYRGVPRDSPPVSSLGVRPQLRLGGEIVPTCSAAPPETHGS